MTNTGMSKKIDALGRVVIPKEVRMSLGFDIGTTVNLYVRDNALVISKPACSCAICGSEDESVEIKGKRLCLKCVEELKAKSAL